MFGDKLPYLPHHFLTHATGAGQRPVMDSGGLIGAIYHQLQRRAVNSSSVGAGKDATRNVLVQKKDWNVLLCVCVMVTALKMEGLHLHLLMSNWLEDAICSLHGPGRSTID